MTRALELLAALAKRLVGRAVPRVGGGGSSKVQGAQRNFIFQRNLIYLGAANIFESPRVIYGPPSIAPERHI